VRYVLKSLQVRFMVFTAANMKMSVFCDNTPRSLAEIDQRLRGVSCFCHYGIMYLRVLYGSNCKR
jgi:hypothetical protein